GWRCRTALPREEIPSGRGTCCRGDMRSFRTSLHPGEVRNEEILLARAIWAGVASRRPADQPVQGVLMHPFGVIAVRNRRDVTRADQGVELLLCHRDHSGRRTENRRGPDVDIPTVHSAPIQSPIKATIAISATRYANPHSASATSRARCGIQLP